MHAKLPAMMIVRKTHSSTTSAIGLTLKPVRSESSSLIVGRSVNVKIVASTAHQTISRTRAPRERAGREVASSTPHCYEQDRRSQTTADIGGYQCSIEAAKFKRRTVGEVAEWLKAAV